MLASSSAILCGVLLICNYVPRDQQTAALDSYAEVLQGGLDGLLQNVARLQEIKGNLNTVLQQKMTTALGSQDGSGFVTALNQVRAQLEQFFGTYTADATAIVGAFDTWIKSSRTSFLAKTASYQAERDLLLNSFNESIETRDSDNLRRRQCAQHYHTQFEGIEFDYLHASGKSFANVARTLAAQSAGLTVLQNAGEADAMRLLLTFDSSRSQPQDAFDNWNLFFQRISTLTGSALGELKTAVQSSIASVDASIVEPNALRVSLGQVKNGYDQCVGTGETGEVATRFSCH
ncbi:hypothetical protein quinque_008291 [Culex quinquefasciatus]